MRVLSPGIRTILLLICTGIITACGIDRGGIIDLPTVVTFRNSAGAAIAGQITATNGSVITVNGANLDIGAAVITINSEAANAAMLVNGLYVVTSSEPGSNTNAWDQVAVSYNVAGGEAQISSFDSGFELLGQQVQTNNLDPANIGSVTLPVIPPSVIAVSGFVKAAGTIDARAIIDYTSTGPALVTGVATSVDSIDFSADIGGQSYDFSEAQSIVTTTGSVQENERIRITVDPALNMGAYSVITIDAAPLLPTSLQISAGISLSGYITAIITQSEFAVSHQAIRTDDMTRFENQTGNIATDRLVQIEGELIENRIIRARTVRFLD